MDHSKAITKSELEEVLSAMSSASSDDSVKHMQEIRQHKTVETIFRMVDSNNDQMITLNEFIKLAEIEGLTFNFNLKFAEQFGLTPADQKN